MSNIEIGNVLFYITAVLKRMPTDTSKVKLQYTRIRIYVEVLRQIHVCFPFD